MISNRDLASISLEDLVNRIDIYHQEMDVLYQALATKMSKQTYSTAFLSDKNVSVIEYWLKVAQEHPQILSAEFDVKGLEQLTSFF